MTDELMSDNERYARAFLWRSHAPDPDRVMDQDAQTYRMGWYGGRQWMRDHLTPKPAEGRGDWMMTMSGRRFYPLDPRPEDVTIGDIAHALGMICRYQGHVTRFYSVAEHCVLMARYAHANGLSIETRFNALMHDAAEAFIWDVVRPLKHALAQYKAIELRVEDAIAAYLGIPSIAKTAVVDAMDDAILYDEGKELRSSAVEPWYEKRAPGLDVQIEGLNPDAARIAFLNEFERLVPLMGLDPALLRGAE